MDLVDAYCATCKEETEQEVLSESRDLIIRCTVCGAFVVCIVENTMCPVSAACSAVRIVTASRGPGLNGPQDDPGFLIPVSVRWRATYRVAAV